MIIKYAFSLALVILAAFSTHSKKIALAGFLELFIIVFLTNMLLPKKPKLIRWLSGFVILLFNAQLLVLYFGGSFISLIMLTNIPSLQGLAGRAFLYGVAALIVIAVSFFPLCEIPTGKMPSANLTVIGLILLLGFTMIFGSTSSPLFGYYALGREFKDYRAMQREVSSTENVTASFYQWGIRSFIDKPADLPEKPNIVLVMTEGLSQRIIEDERQIMPHVAALQKESLNFANYYNHTFATYRGIIGQLYSGYQLSNLDTNTLISIQDILNDKGYRTSFINTEPANLDFANYLGSMGFDQIISDSSLDSGTSNTASDKEAYELLYKTIMNEEKSGEPFFTAIYTYGTHVTLDSEDQKFGDGSDPLLNKFHNADAQFGTFFDRYRKTSLAKDTILVFTADHATYAEEEYQSSFSDEVCIDTSCDRMPLVIYYPGVKPMTIDAGGRNTLDMAPTILDYIDVDAPNYFLGTSLFSKTQNDNSYDQIYYDGSKLLTTRGNRVEAATEEQEQVVLPLIKKYLAAKTQPPQKP